MTATQSAYLVLIGAVVAERLVELVVTCRNLAWARARGGREHAAPDYPLMVATHTLFLVACPLEVVALERPFVPLLGFPMLALVAAAMALRYWAIVTLGRSWTTRIVVVPGMAVARGGPYRWLRHPNYLAVVVEVAALPLVHTAWLTALAFSAANAVVLRRRIAAEEGALRAATDYDAALEGRPALVPGRRR